MLTKITIRNFKVFGEEVEIPLDDNGMVFIGANNAGKTSALQALALWHTGLQKWMDKFGQRETLPAKFQSVSVNRLDLLPLPVNKMDLIWYQRKTKSGQNANIRIDLIVEGLSHGKSWECGLEFDYANAEVFYCRPLRVDDKGDKRMEIPEDAKKTNLAFLPSMSGLASEENQLQDGSINVKIGQGQTAEVLRNLCYRVYEENQANWQLITGHIDKLFGVQLNPPSFRPSRGDIVMDYTNRDSNVKLDLQSSGRGMQQTLLLLAYLYAKPEGTVLLLDEPDAHLEILRQGQVFRLIMEEAQKRQSQIIAASHSEVLLNEATERGSVVAFIGKPHLMMENKKDEVLKALREIGFESYQQAEIKGWVLYLEGESDLKILRAFAEKLNHPVKQYLENPFVSYLDSEQPKNGRRHFNAVKEAKEDLLGVLLVDKIEKDLMKGQPLKEMMWEKREIENYLCHKQALVSFVTNNLNYDLFGFQDINILEKTMKEETDKLIESSKNLNRPLPFGDDIKASGDFLVPLFKNFSKRLIENEPRVVLRKSDFYKLVQYIPTTEIDKEVKEKLDGILEIAKKAQKHNG